MERELPTTAKDGGMIESLRPMFQRELEELSLSKKVYVSVRPSVRALKKQHVLSTPKLVEMAYKAIGMH